MDRSVGGLFLIFYENLALFVIFVDFAVTNE